VTIEAPRRSLMAAVRRQAFDELLLGHFAKVTLHGVRNLGFLPVVTRFGDAGGAQTGREVDEYLADYQRRPAAIDETLETIDALAADL
jgi:hypothetical protein